MNKLFILLNLSLFGCVSPESADRVSVTNALIPTNESQTTLLRKDIDLENSKVEWKGTKMLGAGSHIGTVNFKEGYLLFDDDMISGGEFIVDMTSIYNTDIPLSDPVPRKNITTHLNSDFETKNFPISKFIITDVDKDGSEYTIIGVMKIRDIEKSISFIANENSEGVYFTEFEFDRFDWKIGENNSWLEQKLVDADISLRITIQVGEFADISYK